MQTKHQGKLHFLLYFLIIAAFALGIILPGLVVRSLSQKPRVVYHGPHTGMLLENAASVSVVDEKTTDVSKLQQTPVPTLKPLIPTPMPTPIAVVSQTPIQNSQTLKTSGYGIAAGGGPVYFDQSELDHYFSSLQALGVRWVRWDMDWSSIQPNNSAGYSWAGPDRVVSTAKKYGINSLVLITHTPKWAANQSCNSDYGCAPANLQMFSQFINEVALRYKDSITYWEIWNEPNILPSWKPRPDAQEYIDILKVAYEKIKDISPQSTVLVGGLSPASDSNGDISPLEFVSTLYESGANKYFDAIAIHPYTYPFLPSHTPRWNNWQQLELIRQLMVSKGDAAKKIWVTEYGAPTGGPGSVFDLDQPSFAYGSDYISETSQKEMAQQALAFYTEDHDWMGPFFWYSLKDDGTSRDTPENFFGLLRYDGSMKPSYDVFKNAIVSNQ